MKNKNLSLALGAAFSMMLGGCAVGPNFKPPEMALPGDASYTPTAMPAKTAASAPGTIAGAAQQFVAGQDIPAQWWEVFHSPALDQLIRNALAHSPSMAAAEATLRQVQES